MIKEETICPGCDEQYIVVANQPTNFCPFCADPIPHDERGEIDMGGDDE